MAAGYCFAARYLRPELGRVTRSGPSAPGLLPMIRWGLFLTVAFLVLRALNVYGDPSPWSTAIPGTGLLSFLNTTKYPPSLLFLLMTIGPAMLVLAWLSRWNLGPTHPLVVIGRVPLFFFLVHFLLAHALAIPFALARYGHADFLASPMPSMGGAPEAYPPGFGYSLAAVYGIWVLVVVLTYPLCVWFAGLKERRRDWWWLGYL
jgi:uncharacterized membrane protein